MQHLPLISHTRPDQIIAWQHGTAVTASQFLSDVEHLASLLPADQYILNVCRDRYHFAVGLAATILSKKVSLLPPSHTPDMVEQLLKYSKGVFCLHDQLSCDIALPKVLYPVMPREKLLTLDEHEQMQVPRIVASQLIAIVFTSGSTGTPVPHEKHWASLVKNVHAQAARLKLTGENGCCLVGTIPPQHMYGFESTILLPLQSGNALHSDQPFYPADIVKALSEVPSPKVLVSTPIHLRLLLDAEIEVPPLALVLSATAPLSDSLAGRIEERFNTPLLEIYGSTETGQIATRNSTKTNQWYLLPDIQLTVKEGQTWAAGGHIEKTVSLNDLIEIVDAEHFTLHGRSQDLINIAGKRNSLANLNHILNSIDGVIDGAFYMPDELTHDHVTRLCACVVAPGVTQAELLAALRQCLDPVFLPRPLLFLKALPRNSTGKLPREALKQLFSTPPQSAGFNA
ncbi:MAG: beta-hydroxyacyl-ACP dehydratase [Methylotenera sp.]|nr:MAG: beta-hydroxyacyl-ACP dehydratase [Methylotenera sp.]